MTSFTGGEEQTDGEPFLASSECRYGALQYPRNDDPIGLSLALYGEWAQAEVDLLRGFLAEGDVFVDVGAHIGTHAIAASDKVGRSGIVVAVEPCAQIFPLLEQNCGDRAGTIRCLQVAMSDSPGVFSAPLIDFSLPLNSGATRLTPGPASDETAVQATTLDDLHLDHCTVVKIDAEGMSAAVLRGATKTILGSRPVVLAEVLDVDEAAAVLASNDWPGYRAFLAQTSAFNPENFRGQARNVFGWAHEVSLLLVPDERIEQVPASREGCMVTAVATLQQVAEVLLRTPRFGDAGPHDRDPDLLLGQLAQQEETLQRWGFRIKALENRVSDLLDSSQQLDNQLFETKQMITEMATSRSWRITAPLRSARKRPR